jgi:hypothetical protein
MTMIETTMSFDEIVEAGMELTENRVMYKDKAYPSDFDAFGINFNFCPEHGCYHAYYGETFPIVNMEPDDVLNLASYMTKKAKPVMMNFGEAIAALKEGIAVARKGWNGKGMYLYMVDAGRYPPSTLVGSLIADTQPDGKVPYMPYIAMKTVSDDVVPWLASQTDVLAEDWVLVDLVPDATEEPAEEEEASVTTFVKVLDEEYIKNIFADPFNNKAGVINLKRSDDKSPFTVVYVGMDLAGDDES